VIGITLQLVSFNLYPIGIPLVFSFWVAKKSGAVNVYTHNIQARFFFPIGTRIATEEDDAQIFIDSGDLPLNFYGNALYFAFKYVGSGKTAQDGTIELDDFRTFEK
jgi:hypothetical protein